MILAGCESHTLTRQPERGSVDPALLLWVAGVALGAAVVAVVVVAIDRRPGWSRVVAATVWLSVAAAAGVGALLMLGVEVRRAQLEARFGCKEIPVARRAPSFYDISCGDGDLNLEPAFFAFFALAAFFTAILGLWILKAPARALWVPCSAALTIAVATGWGAVTSVHDLTDGTFYSAVITFVVSAVAGGALIPEYTRWLQRPDRARAP